MFVCDRPILENRDSLQMPTGFGEWLKHARDDADMTGQEVATNAGISQASIAKYEAGERNPTRTTVLKIARALGAMNPGDALIAAGFLPLPFKEQTVVVEGQRFSILVGDERVDAQADDALIAFLQYRATRKRDD